MIARRQWLVALGVGLALGPHRILAQQQKTIYRLGFLGVGSAKAYAYRIDALRAGLRDLGYAEGKNIMIEFRWAEGNLDRLRELAVELVESKVDVLVTHAVAGTRAARQASTTIPIVMTDVSDAVAAGLVESLARPGSNITGSSFLAPQLNAKRLEMLRQILPRIRRIALLLHPDNPGLPSIRKEMQGVIASRGLEVREYAVHGPADFESAFQAMKRDRIEAVLVVEHPVFTVNTGVISKLAISHQLPLAGFSEFAAAGGLFGYEVDFPALYRRAAYFVDKILKGARPAELPVEQPTKFELIVNMKTARLLGIAIPNELLLRADKVIE
jgi:putative tryptophan/tyrosine transport system substrate-binding protein